MQDLLVGLWREMEATVFFVTHDVNEAVYLGDRLHIYSTAPGTILHDMEAPPPDRPARVMQREKEFMQVALEVRDIIEKLEASTRAEEG
jgi:NitT/TauT family transport system ATP-binding protein